MIVARRTHLWMSVVSCPLIGLIIGLSFSENTLARKAPSPAAEPRNRGGQVVFIARGQLR